MKAKIAQNNSQVSEGGMTGISVKPGQDGPCGFRPFDFHSILKIENQNFAIVIFNV